MKKANTTPLLDRLARLEVLVERQTEDLDRLEGLVNHSFDRSVGAEIVSVKHEHTLEELTKDVEGLRHSVRGLQQAFDLLSAPKAPWWRRVVQALAWVGKHLGGSESKRP